MSLFWDTYTYHKCWLVVCYMSTKKRYKDCLIEAVWAACFRLFFSILDLLSVMNEFFFWCSLYCCVFHVHVHFSEKERWFMLLNNLVGLLRNEWWDHLYIYWSNPNLENIQIQPAGQMLLWCPSAAHVHGNNLCPPSKREKPEKLLPGGAVVPLAPAWVWYKSRLLWK